MSTSINKNGVWYADGSDINHNLIKNGAFVDSAFTWVNWGAPPTREVVSVNGKKYAHIISNTNKFQGYSQNTGMAITANTQYTISFIAFGNTNGEQLTWGIHYCDSSNSILSQSWHDYTVTTEPQKYSTTFTVPNNTNIVRFNLMVGQRDGAVHNIYYSDVKLEEGTIATPWIPNTSDEIYISDTQGFNEGYYTASVNTGSLNSNEFIEL